MRSVKFASGGDWFVFSDDQRGVRGGSLPETCSFEVFRHVRIIGGRTLSLKTLSLEFEKNSRKRNARRAAGKEDGDKKGRNK